MVRPSSLIRDDDGRMQIQANANNIHTESLDCGITAMGCCNGPSCQKLGNKSTFLTALMFAGFFQGGVETYFRISARQAALQYDYDPIIMEWLLFASGILQGIFALGVAYWGNRIHRVAWLGGLVMLQAMSCLLLVIPTLVHHGDSSTPITPRPVDILCTTLSGNLVAGQTVEIVTLVILFVVQLTIALANIAFFALGLSYIDDNCREHESPALIGGALAAKYWGSQLGLAVSFLVGATPFGWWLGWAILSPALFLTGFFIALFPKRLLSTVVRLAANNIIEAATASQMSLSNVKLLADIGFFRSMQRLLCNKILLFNVIATVFLYTGVYNFMFHETNYLQSRFFLPSTESDGINNEWMSVTVASFLLKPPLVALAILVAGLIIAKANPSARKLAGWNIITASIVIGLLIANIWVDCPNENLAGAHRGKITKPFCAHDCNCAPNTPFTPVCPQDSQWTYYSPCHAGCTTEITVNKLRAYGNCTCGTDVAWRVEGLVATEGSCNMDNCQTYWILFQASIVLAAVLLGSGLVGNLIITIRCVLPQDKALALSFELWMGGLIVFLPGRYLYRWIADSTCQFWTADQTHCFIHETPDFGNWMLTATAILVGVSVFFDVIVFILVYDMPMYGDDEEDAGYRPIPMQPIPHMEESSRLNNIEGSPPPQFYENNREDPLAQFAPDSPIMSDAPPSLINSIQNSQLYQQRSVSPISTSTAPAGGLLHQKFNRSAPLTPNGPLYAEIQRHTTSEDGDHLDFKLQAVLPPPMAEGDDDELNGPGTPLQQNLRNYMAPTVPGGNKMRRMIPKPGAAISSSVISSDPSEPDSVRHIDSNVSSPNPSYGPRTRNRDVRALSPETDF